MNKLLFAGALALLVVACSKDKFETKPKITSVSFPNEVIPATGGVFVADLGFTDKEGDISKVYVIRRRINRRDTSTRTLPYDVPETNKENQGTIRVSMPTATDLLILLSPIRIPGSTPPQFETDSLDLRFYVKDAEGNTSDTTAAKRLYVTRQ